MSLYYEAADVINDIRQTPALLKQRVYNSKTAKSSPGAIFALVSESIKWSEVLTEVINNSRLLHDERKLTPALSLLLAHDLLLSKKGLSASKKHPLYALISKHKARLTSELTRVRIKRGQPTLAALLQSLTPLPTDTALSSFHPRWVRINTIKTTSSDCLETHFPSYTPVDTLADLATSSVPTYCLDPHIPNLLAFHPSVDLTKTRAYSSGLLILQDKASCFPAYLLDPSSIPHAADAPATLIDGCAAPGNKTTHLASIVHDNDDLRSKTSIIACERNAVRAETLQKMVTRAGAGTTVTVKKGQDFLALRPSACSGDVIGILLDPSCSGSGIVGRNDVEDAAGAKPIVLPDSPRQGTATTSMGTTRGTKRKREIQPPASSTPTISTTSAVLEEEEQDLSSSSSGEEDLAPSSDDTAASKLATRLASLSAFQSKLVKHALLSFPACTRVTYSTCSVHAEENERVVVDVLGHPAVRERGWRILRREEQVDGLRRWERRGDLGAVRNAVRGKGKDEGHGRGALEGSEEEVAEACIRCVKGDREGTMGFFVAAFVRDVKRVGDTGTEEGEGHEVGIGGNGNEEHDEWAGFSD